jgi:hypothetical protein
LFRASLLGRVDVQHPNVRGLSSFHAQALLKLAELDERVGRLPRDGAAGISVGSSAQSKAPDIEPEAAPKS